MRRRRRPDSSQAIEFDRAMLPRTQSVGLVLSGGGARAAYQVGALRALTPMLEQSNSNISVIMGSSVGAINGLIIGACLKTGLNHAVEEVENLWIERTFRNTFKGSPSRAFLRAIRLAVLQYLSPGPHPSDHAIFDPSPLMETVDTTIMRNGGLTVEQRAPGLFAIGVMTTVEGLDGQKRKPLLFLSCHKKVDQQILDGASFEVCYVDSLGAKHGFASAALPAILPPVELDSGGKKIRLVDGGISQNVPVDPAVRLGADHVIVIDISGRSWWHDQYGEAHDTRPTWEVPAGDDTYCLRPPQTFSIRPSKALGPILKHAVGRSTSKFMTAVGPVWPIFSLLKNKLGEDSAYEVMTYVALDQDYLQGLMEFGFQETSSRLKAKGRIEFEEVQTTHEAGKTVQKLSA